MSSSGGKRTGTKRTKKESEEPGTWECTVCTYRNKYEAFKCEMCDTRKGTSTRKPRLNQNTIEQQQLMQNMVLQQQQSVINETKRRSQRSQSSPTPTPSCSSRGPTSPAESLEDEGPSPQSKTPTPQPDPTPPLPNSNNCTPKMTRSQELKFLKGVDRNSARTLAVTVNGITVVVTDYKLKRSNQQIKQLNSESVGPTCTSGPDIKTESPESAEPR